MSKAVLVITTWTHCGNCTSFKNQGHMQAIQDRYRNDADINVVVITLNGARGDNMPELKKSYPKFVQYMVMYPSFFLATADTWNNQSSTNLKLAAFKIKLNPDFSFVMEKNSRGQMGPVMEPGYTYKSSSVIEWADEQLRKNPIFNTSNVQQNNPKYGSTTNTKSNIVKNVQSTKPSRTTNRQYGRGRNLPNLNTANNVANDDSTYRVVIVRNNRTILSEEIPATAAQKLIDTAQKYK